MRTRQQSAPAVISIAPGITPRLLRLRDAPAYLGMDRNRFNAEVRPYVKVLSIGKQGVAFDRLELDQWADRQLVQLVPARIDTAVVEVEHSRRSERPVRKGVKKWGVRRVPAFTEGTAPGTSISESEGTDAFAKALALAKSKKRSATSGCA